MIVSETRPGHGSKEWRRLEVEQFTPAPTEQQFEPLCETTTVPWSDEAQAAYKAVCSALLDQAQWEATKDAAETVVAVFRKAPLFAAEDQDICDCVLSDIRDLQLADSLPWDADSTLVVENALKQAAIRPDYRPADDEDSGLSLLEFAKSVANIDWRDVVSDCCETPDLASETLCIGWDVEKPVCREAAARVAGFAPDCADASVIVYFSCGVVVAALPALFFFVCHYRGSLDLAYRHHHRCYEQLKKILKEAVDGAPLASPEGSEAFLRLPPRDGVDGVVNIKLAQLLAYAWPKQAFDLRVLYELVQMCKAATLDYRNRLEKYKAKPLSPKELQVDLARFMCPNVAPHVMPLAEAVHTYPKPPPEPRSPPPTTNALTRLIRFDMVMATQTGKAHAAKKAADPKKKAVREKQREDKKAEEAARKEEKKAAKKEKVDAGLAAAREQERDQGLEKEPEPKDLVKKTASLDVLRQKEKEGEQASQKLRGKRAADQENAATSRAPLPLPERAALGKARRGEMLERSGETSSLSGRSPKWELLGFRTVEVASVSDWKAQKKWEASINELFEVAIKRFAFLCQVFVVGLNISLTPLANVLAHGRYDLGQEIVLFKLLGDF
ncbi:unnamed protein product, partial [Symbiodinium microadriaticum]